MKTAERIQKLPPYLFAEIDRKIASARANGVDVISLGIGDPDQPTPDPIVQRMQEEAAKPENHRYPSYEGLPGFRKAVADWYLRRFNVQLDYNSEVVSLIGSKEGIAHISLCYVNPGDVNLVPDPGYPVYATGTLFAGGTSHKMPLLKENKFLPDLSSIPTEVARKAKLLFVNYPNNPTGAIATADFFSELVRYAREFDIVVCHDAAYTEIGYDGYTAPSFLQTPGAKDVGVEFHSLSKTYNMTGWRIGWAAGNSEVIEALGRIKTNIDSGIFEAIQKTGITALDESNDVFLAKMNQLYTERRNIAVNSLRELGWKTEPPKATIYLWVPVPPGYQSSEFAALSLEKSGVVVTPGLGYGDYGEGYFRISLTTPTDRLQEAFARWKEAGITYA